MISTRPPAPHYLKVWGRDEHIFLKQYGSLEVWFDDYKSYKKARSCAMSGLMAITDAHGEEALIKPVADVVLAYGGRLYSFTDANYWYGYPAETVEFSWSENNESCDCNRSAAIQQHCDPNFPTLDCGDTIELISLVIRSVRREDA